ncbi:hypothetical protein L873DRAFT_1722259 [Choiromyces venosus 120613-1]|uniref:U6 snRNA phosphodiesterase n=1 Tax=Choiromyces venosus 120613-1 TaxID=1336337 RepID=A0A3N4ITU2_9PEZI|nr:hypothetical protein L873DRAFT_1722259 [Choiromyces venosus 120613-1]
MPPLTNSLVEYSDSDSDSPPPAKVTKTIHPTTPSTNQSTTLTSKYSKTSSSNSLPPLPSRFHDLYAVAPRVGQQDDPSLHGGRKRSIPHVQGNWPTHVFIEWHLSRSEFDILNDAYHTASTITAETGLKLESHLQSDLGSEQPLHLSLSKPNVLTTAQREGFLELLRDRLDKTRIKPFSVEFTGFEFVSNNDRTRWFFVLSATKGEDTQLPRLLQLANHTFESFEQPPLYAEENGDKLDGFHVSLAWSLTGPDKETKTKVLEALKKHACWDKILGDREDGKLKLVIDAIKVKIGSVVHIIELGKKEKQGEPGNPKKRRASYDIHEKRNT